MQIITTNNLKNKLIEQLKNNIDKCGQDRLLIVSNENNNEIAQYKTAIKNRCKEFNIEVLDRVFGNDNYNTKLNLESFFNYELYNGFVILQPFETEDLNYLRENIKVNNYYRDLDGFTFKSLGKVMNGSFKHLPATAKAIILTLEDMQIDVDGKNIIIANSTNVIGKPLSMYLNYEKATVTLLNSKTKNSKELIKNCDIFVSGIGKPNFYNNEYFKDGQIIIDAGTSYIDNKLVGDIDYNSLNDLDIKVVTCKQGIGAITTLCLLHGFID